MSMTAVSSLLDDPDDPKSSDALIEYSEGILENTGSAIGLRRLFLE